MNPRYKPFVIGAGALVLVWVLVWIGFRIGDHIKVTPEKVLATLKTTDLAKMDAAARARRLRELAGQLNALGGKERRTTRADREWDRLWRQMTEAEKSEFVERTMPTGVKQMLTAFEQLPEERRRFAITNAIARMRDRRDRGEPAMGGRPNEEPLSEELQKKMITTGLKTFYAESSAQTKAEVAPLLEEMQRMMEGGKLFRR
jgi:hypothetical protein